MNYNIKNFTIFPTCINYIENFLTNIQCENIVNYARQGKYKNHGALIGNAISNHGLKQNVLQNISLHVKSCENVLNECQNICNLYTNTCGYQHAQINDSWINFQKKGSKLLSHKHPGNIISGVIYLAVDENSSVIAFENPNPYIGFTRRNGQTEYNAEFSSIKPKLGSCIIFPSWLSHSSGLSINESNERVALSFNAN
jgi:hypothetical protein